MHFNVIKTINLKENCILKWIDKAAKDIEIRKDIELQRGIPGGGNLKNIKDCHTNEEIKFWFSIRLRLISIH